MIKDKKNTYILLGTLAVCLVILVILCATLMQKLLSEPAVQTDPEIQYISIPDLDGMTLSEAKLTLDSAEISYEIVPADSKIPNRVLSFEYSGKIEDGKILVELGTSVKLRANEVAPDKVVYLTFDDGPTRDNTIEILDILDEFDAKATFFVQGKNAKNYPDKMKETVKRGHLVGCHSFTHEYDDIYSSFGKFKAEVERYEDEMRDIFGDEFDKMPKLIRFPGGSSTNGRLTKGEAKEYINELRNMGYSVYDWTALTNDRDNSYRHEGESDIDYYMRSLKASLKSAKENSEPLIVLMHDFGKCRDNLRDLMTYLQSEGYYFDTLDNCPEYTFAER